MMDNLPSVRRGTKDTDHALLEQEKARFRRLDRKTFTERQQYRDTNQISYAPARTQDPLYKALLRRKMIDPLASDRDGLPQASNVGAIANNGTIGVVYGRVLLYARFPADRRLHRWPAGTINFTDPNTGKLYSGRVRQSQFEGRIKTGYVLLDQVVYWGRMADPSQFPAPKRKPLAAVQENGQAQKKRRTAQTNE